MNAWTYFGYDGLDVTFDSERVGAHDGLIVSAFSHGLSTELLQPSFGRDSENGDHTYYYVNRFVDRDMSMRYRGGAVGHTDLAQVATMAETYQRPTTDTEHEDLGSEGNLLPQNPTNEVDLTNTGSQTGGSPILDTVDNDNDEQSVCDSGSEKGDESDFYDDD
ncbi:hypothetical protein FRB99_001341 [Tulasnella sp. 403]|nr:hypothetical protein FRB99_001341 [Tulasnella sp. 403]